MTLQKSAAVVVPVACRRRSHAGKPRSARELSRPRVDYGWLQRRSVTAVPWTLIPAPRITQHEVDAKHRCARLPDLSARRAHTPAGVRHHARGCTRGTFILHVGTSSCCTSPLSARWKNGTSLFPDLFES